MGFADQKGVNIGGDRGHHVAGIVQHGPRTLGRRGWKDDALRIGMHDAIGRAGGVGLRHRLWITRQVHISGVGAIARFQPPQHPGQAVVNLDMAGWIVQTRRAQEMAAAFMSCGPIAGMATGAGEGGGPAPPGAENEYAVEGGFGHRNTLRRGDIPPTLSLRLGS